MEKTDVSPNVGKPDAAEQGSTVKVHYKGTLDDGEVFDSSEGGEPIEFTIGNKQVIKGFEDGVVGMKIGETKKVSLPPDQAYGDPNPQLKQKLPKEAFGDIEPKEGMTLALQHPQAPGPIPVQVVKVEDDGITIDMNHPLAGKTLTFELTLVDIN